jgi:AcrR family transcriptional regulator
MPTSAPTSAPTSSPRPYHLHRERQRRRILEAAEELFDQKGIDRVTMTEIISATDLRASTIYQYFSSKDDIVWAILEGMLVEFAARAKEATDKAKTSFDKITALLELMADDLINNQAKVRFMAQFDAMYARDWSAERLLTLEAQLYPEGFRYLGGLIREGVSDGSLRDDLDPELTMHAVMNAVVGTQRRLASLGNRVELEYGQPIGSLFRETTRVMLRGLRAT